jgi:DNA-binding NtrC family response regulator
VQERILVIDDEAAIADSLVSILRKFGYVAQCAYSAAEALQVVHSFNPALVITDVAMGGISGIDLAILLRTRMPNCKVLLWSGQATTEDLVEEARRRGFSFEIVAKPIHPNRLLPQIARILSTEEAT